MDNLIKLIILQIIIIFEIIAIPGFADTLDSPSNKNGTNSVDNNMRPGSRDGRDIRIDHFSITPKHLTAGQKAELTWHVTGAAHVYIDNDHGLHHAEVSPNGQITVTPLKTTSYTLTAYDRQMPAVSAVATIDVSGLPPAPSVSISAEPEIVYSGEKTALKWETRYADTISIDNGIGPVGSFGSFEIKPSKSITYVISATGLGGTGMASITITVVDFQTGQAK